MKRLYHRPLLYLASIFAMASCSQIIDVDIPEHEPLWTFSGNITAGEAYYGLPSGNDTLRIFNYFILGDPINLNEPHSPGGIKTVFALSKTIALNNRNNNHTFFDDGEMLIFKEGDLVENPTVSNDMTFDETPRYVSELEYEPEATYLFQMSTNDDITLTATQTMPKKVEPRNIRVEESNTEFIVRFTIDDPSGVNHYLFQCYQIYNGSFGGTSDQLEFNITNPNFFWYFEDFDFFEDSSPYRRTGVLPDIEFNGQSQEIEMRIRKNEHLEGISPNKKLLIEISSLSLAMHRYFQSYAQTSTGFTPFSEPVILNFNVENGLGAVVAVTTSFLEIEL
ncbi:MAG: DUF4249 domain-containing protein [Cryomorphaceae bacterium]|nr:DUF4249 domain-containing protein [Cryomorphaceae bacterium]